MSALLMTDVRILDVASSLDLGMHTCRWGYYSYTTCGCCGNYDWYRNSDPGAGCSLCPAITCGSSSTEYVHSIYIDAACNMLWWTFAGRLGESINWSKDRRVLLDSTSIAKSMPSPDTISTTMLVPDSPSRRCMGSEMTQGR